MKTKSKEVIQGYVLTSAKYDFSRFEKLILYKLVEIAQDDLKGKKLNAGYSINRSLFDDVILEIPIKDIMPDGSKNHYQVKKALVSLRNKTIEYEDDEEWRVIGIIEKPIIKKYSDKLIFEVQPLIWEVLLNFTKGHSKYELNAAMSFKSVYAMRFFEMFSKNLKPLSFSIETIKERFGLKDKYTNRPSDFIKRVILPAKKELDLKSEYSFNYSVHKEGRQISYIKFVPYYIASNRNQELYEQDLRKKTSLRFDLSREFIQYLKRLGFSNDGIRNNLKLLKEANQKIDLYDFLKKVARKANEAKSPPAYIIGALKKYLKNKDSEVPVDPKQSAQIADLLSSVSSKKTFKE